MNSDLLLRIAKSSAHTKSRIENGNFIIQNPILLEELIRFCFKTNDKLHIRACCILEKVFEININLSFSHIAFICDNLYSLKNDSAIRSISRFIMLLTQDNSKKKYLTENQLEKITEVSFDWLLANIRIAPKYHAILTLFELGKTQDWIYPELRQILEKDATDNSAGYKSIAKKILKKI
jgi:hypothetical protein